LTVSSDDRVLGAALGLSILLHAAMLSVHFRFPDPLHWKAASQPLEVVLVNAKTREKPAKADILAQANLDRGGNVDERRRAKTPVQQQRLLAQAQESPSRVPVENPRAERADQPAPHPAGRDLADLSLAAMRLQAQIDKQIEQYQKRPRKKFIGARATEYRFAQYEEDWRVKIERVGTLNYPAEARGKMYGNLRLTVTIRPDGNIESIELDRSSGLKVLDAAAFKIVRMATPFAAFPPDIRSDTDLLVITRTWFFGQGDKIWTE
jgi:protein TonB